VESFALVSRIRKLAWERVVFLDEGARRASSLSELLLDEILRCAQDDGLTD